MPRYPKAKDLSCGDCACFCRHYVRDGSRYSPLTLGHCVHLRTKDRWDGETCPGWKAREKK